MKKFFFIVLLFFALSSLLGFGSLDEKQSVTLIKKLSQDNLHRLALLEVDYFLTNFASSVNQKEVKLEQAKLLNKIENYRASIKILSEFTTKDFQKEIYEDIFFLQAKNYFFIHDFEQSLIFFQNVVREKTDLHYSNAFYQSAAHLILGNFLLTKQIITSIPKKTQTKREQQILEALKKWKPKKEITKILANKNFSKLEKLIIVNTFTELDLQENNTKKALEKVFLFYVQNKISDGILTTIDFLIGKTLYKLAQEQQFDPKILQEAKNFLISYQEKNHNPTRQSYFYLGGIYAKLAEYNLAHQQYNNLLQYVEYAKLTNFVFNYVELSQFLQKNSLVAEILQKAINNTKDPTLKKKFIIKLVDFYTTQKECDKAAIYLSKGTSSADTSKNLENNFILGQCYFDKNEDLKTIDYLENIPFNHTSVAKITKMMAIVLGKQKNKEKFLKYFDKIKYSLSKEHQIIQINTLQYYYYAKDYQGFIKNFQDLTKTNFFLPRIEETKQLAQIYAQTGRQKKSNEIYFGLLKETLTESLEIKDKQAIAQSLISTYQKQKSYSKIAEVHKVLLKDLTKASKPKTELLIARNYLAAKKIPLAQKWFRRVAYKENAENIPNYAEFKVPALYYLARIYASQKKHKSVIAILKPELKKITTKNKWYNRLNLTIAQAYSNLEQWQNSLKYYKKVKSKKNSKEDKITKANIKKIKAFLAKQK